MSSKLSITGVIWEVWATCRFSSETMAPSGDIQPHKAKHGQCHFSFLSNEEYKRNSEQNTEGWEGGYGK